ncbi:hypothetical protein ONZ51_g13040 [Trametes cubensis]|uniref:Uncharacterized protein n=1 Tax=Trametes cubensis TaxID=1111947 RepID=A0AAD7TER5_9APHY|nr:hypothetical protein ONZ51_g13040 [Trametes cubensis]
MASSSSASMPDKHAPTQSPQGGDKTIGASAPAASSQVVYPTRADIMRLVANMDPDELTIIGHWPPNDNPLSPDSAEDMTVVYCSTVIGQECNTPCTLYNGPGNVCLAAPNTNCLLATVNVSFCATSTCTGSVPASCNILNQFCPTHAMPGGYCDTPDTQSIGVPAS